MRQDITNEVVTKDGKRLDQVVWVDTDGGEACIFCHDHEGRKIPTDTDPTGYETLVVKGEFNVEKTAAPLSNAQPHGTFDWGHCACPYPFSNFVETDRDGRNGSSVHAVDIPSSQSEEWIRSLNQSICEVWIRSLNQFICEEWIRSFNQYICEEWNESYCWN